MDDYQVHLDVFEGPLDLLVYLIRKNEIDIYDIHIALLAGQYLEYVARIERINLEKAGDFLLMASSLLQIKSRMLLPRPEGEDEAWEDPRTELVEKILEYLQFKEVAEHMRRLEEASARQAERGFSELELYRRSEEDQTEIDATVNELILAFGHLLVRQRQPEPVHRVTGEKISAAGRIRAIREILAARRRVLFSDLVDESSTRMWIVVTLVALLEMAKGGEITVDQADTFGQLWIARRRLKKPEEPAGL
ncbi:MAG TPA: segregation/condensation protein A, partial [Candidatus Glassbacteria bacterium]|nr:segregation/condensation protein A [Candidatus Glassbacteria bacterium]